MSQLPAASLLPSVTQHAFVGKGGEEGCVHCTAARTDPVHQTDAGNVDHPSHYGGDQAYETIKVIEAWQLGFSLGNAVKYISRAGKKGDEIEDLKKARWYLERRISQLESK